MKNTWHRHILRVHYKETDQMKVVHHANYVSWFEIGRTEMMREAGVAYGDMENVGLLLPVLDLDIKYKKPAHYDECIAIYTKVTQFSPVRLEFKYEVRRIENELCSSGTTHMDPSGDKQADQTGDLLATGKTKHMWLNEQWKPARIDRAAPEVYALLGKINHQDNQK